MDTISSSTDGYVLRFVNEDLENKAFTLSKYYSGIIRNWTRGTPLLFAMKTEEGDSLVGYAVVDKIVNLWEMPPEEETYAKEHRWKIALTLRGATRFKTPLLIKNSTLGSDPRRGAFLHGAKLTEHQIGTLLDQAEYERIIDLGREDDLKEYLLISDKDLEKALQEEESIQVESKYELVIEFDSEEEQKGAYLKLTGMGYRCKVLTL